MPLVVNQLVLPSVNVDALGLGLVRFRAIIDPLDLVDPTKSLQFVMEVATDIPGQPDANHAWSTDSTSVWVGCPLRTGKVDGNFRFGTGDALAGKRLRTTIVNLATPVTLVGVHELVAAASAQVIS